MHQPINIIYLRCDIISLTSLKATYKCCFHIRCFQLHLFKALVNWQIWHSRLIRFIIMQLVKFNFKPRRHLKRTFHFSQFTYQAYFRQTVASYLVDAANQEDRESLVLPLLSSQFQHSSSHSIHSVSYSHAQLASCGNQHF